MSPISALPDTPDPRIAAKGYVHPERLVSTEWLAAHLDHPSLRLLECNEDVLLYSVEHIPGAQKLDWHIDLNDQVERDYIARAAFESLLPAEERNRFTACRREFLRQPGRSEKFRGMHLNGLRHRSGPFPMEISLSQVETPEGPIIIIDITSLHCPPGCIDNHGQA